MNYTPYHVHTDMSLLDSCSNYKEYADRAVSEGMTAISFSEHGKPLNWVEKKLYCDSVGLKYMHSVEIYLTRNLTEKIRDNFHTVLIAKNEDGVKELNSLLTLSCQEDHTYYVNRLTFDEFLSISNNIISTSACLASPLNRLSEDDWYYDALCRKYTFFEVQPHANEEQRAFNAKLLQLANKYNKPIIAGTDTHSVTAYKAECRDVLVEAKNKKYDDDGIDLTWKTYDELVQAFTEQNVLSGKQIKEAIENTNRMASFVEPFDLDMDFKYPLLYGSREADAAKFIERVWEKFEYKIANGIIPTAQEKAFRKALAEEIDVFKKLKMEGFMLSMSEIISWCKDNEIAIGTARGSVGGSRVAYVLDIIDLNPETWKTNFYRFANPDRLEAGDIDIDCVDSDRPAIFDYIVKKFGVDKTARVAAFGTLSDLNTIEDIGRALFKRYAKKHNLDQNQRKDPKNPYNLTKIDEIKSQFHSDPEATRKAYPELFYYYDGLYGTRISQSVHPAGMVISSVTLDDNYGVFLKDGERCLMLDMDNAHEVNLIKYDLLILKTVQVIRDTCNFLGESYPKSHEVDWNDEAVWNSMLKSPVGIFQMEGSFAFDSLKKFRPKNIFDVTLVTACIRPSGESYRNKLLAHVQNHNGNPEIDELLSENLGYLVYQEDILRFLMEICGLSGGEADTVRRGIAKKKKEVLDAAMPKVIEGYCANSDKPRDIAEEEVKAQVQIMEDASSYMFGRNHAIAYSLLTYLCAYYRHYYPLQFITAFLNTAANDDDITNGTKYAGLVGIKMTSPKWGLSRAKYFYNEANNSITKGLASVKYIGEAVADELYELANSREFGSFIDVLEAISNETSLNTKQLDILIKLDFFSAFGNMRELLYLTSIYYDTLKRGNAKQIARELVDGTEIGYIISKYSCGTTKSGAQAASYTITDMRGLLSAMSENVFGKHMEDFSDIEKARMSIDSLGYMGFVSGKEEDRSKLFVEDMQKACRRKDGKQFGWSIITQSIGSGKRTRFTVFNKEFNKAPFKAKDIIRCNEWRRDGEYFTLVSYSIL